MPFGPRSTEADLRAMARAHIEAGRLPVSFPRDVYAGYGSGVLCELCGQPIRRAEVEYEVIDTRTGARFMLHVICHACWQLECVGAYPQASPYGRIAPAHNHLTPRALPELTQGL